MATPTPRIASSIVKLAAGALLLNEKRTIRELRTDVDNATKMAAGDATQHNYLRDAALLTMLLHSSQTLKTTLEATLRKAKKRAREAAARRLQIELRALGELEAAAAVPLVSAAIGDIRAVTSAEALALAWRQKAIYESIRAGRTDASTAEAIGKTNIDSSVDRTGATESAQAYNEGHVEAAQGLDLGDNIVDRWEALLDACPRCSGFDGDTTPVGEPFANGEEPSQAHPRCRCMRVTTRV